MVPRLPPELTDRIIDFVSGLIGHERNPTLYSCALTCRAWLPASLFHLYGDEIYVPTHKHFETLVRVSRIPHISTSLQSVRALSLFDAREPEHAWVHRFVLTLGHTFVAIKELRITEIKWNEVTMHPAVPSFGFAQFRCVTKLHLYRCNFRSFRQFQCIICAFPQLRYLDVSNSGAPSPPTLAPILRLPPLTHLYFALHPNDCLQYYRWFASMSFQPSLQTVCLHAHMHSLQDVGVILQNHARCLEEVTLYFESDTPPSSLYELNLHQCTALRRLQLQSIPHISLAGVLDLVSPESRIHALEISLFLESAEPEWERASRMLEDERFCALRQFKLKIKDECLFKEAAAQQRIDVSSDELRFRWASVEHTHLFKDEEAPQRMRIDTTFDPLHRRGVSVDVKIWKSCRRPPYAGHMRGFEESILARFRTGGWVGRRQGFV